MSRLYSSRRNQGFTIVELLACMLVIATLTLITALYFGNWRGRAAQTEVQNDLKNVAAAMENARNFGTGYPSTIPGTFHASENVSIQLMSSTSTTFCINGQSIPQSDVKFYITHQMSPTAGVCP